MLREVVSGADYSIHAIVGLLVFFVVFVAICAWVFTRRRQTVDRWAGLPLDADEARPREPRTSATDPRRNAQ